MDVDNDVCSNCAGGEIGDQQKTPATRAEKLKILSSLIEGIVFNGNFDQAIEYINTIIEP